MYYKVIILYPGGYFPCSNTSDPACMQMMQHRMMAGGEMDIEGPYGEMDIEPGELDIEGPMAFQMLRQMGMGRNMTDSHFPEITLNNHVLEAMQKRFGVNTTAGIQRMSSNPEFQAFMYQVLTHSSPISLAEFNANLSKAAVNEIIRNLDTGATTNQRISAGNLNHALLNTQGSASNGASLTLDNNPMSGLFGGVSPFGPFPGQVPQLMGSPAALTGGAQPGSFQALVQQPHGEGGEPGEAAEVKGRRTETTTVKSAISTNTTHTHRHAVAARLVDTKGATQNNTRINPTRINPITTAKTQAVIPTVKSQTASVQTNQSQTSSVVTGAQPSQQPAAVQPPVSTKEKDIVGKDSKQGISKDQRRRMEKAEKAQNIALASQPANTQQTGNTQNAAIAGNTQSGSNTQLGVGNPQPGAANTQPGAANTQPGAANTQPGANNPPPAGPGAPLPGAPSDPTFNRDSIPIGLKEAGLVPEVKNNTVPVKAESGYTSTGFAIAAGTIIALIIIFGPIACMLWKMKEKRDERARKKKAYKNRDMSENNIMESMILNDFGKGGSMASVTNERAEPYDYFHYGKDRYSMINADIGEMDKTSGNPEVRKGRLP